MSHWSITDCKGDDGFCTEKKQQQHFTDNALCVCVCVYVCVYTYDVCVWDGGI